MPLPRDLLSYLGAEEDLFFSNGINAILITSPEREFYFLSGRICDQGISARVLLRAVNSKSAEAAASLDVFRFQCEPDLKFIILFKGLFFCSRLRDIYFRPLTKLVISRITTCRNSTLLSPFTARPPADIFFSLFASRRGIK